ncbi:MAG: sigma-70 family RNA polymerase sigma factor [Bacteroidetes bacterium]|jgi:RNA polymerase sigma-70 factor (ECF subfamily)|nr:sigma-70 family RNA polymerase sigma factor [Bacteroidota bacterium]
MTVAEYNKCVDEYADRLFRFVIKFVKDEDQANDLVQETFTKTWEKVKTIEYTKAKSYLFTAAYHLVLNYFRQKKRLDDLDEVNMNEHAHNEQYSDIKEVLNRALDQLPEIQKTVILLRDYEGYNYSDIGEMTNLSESQVKVYIYRGRMALKEKLGSIKAVI